LTKLDLIKKISHKTGIERQDVTAVLESMMINVKDLVAEGETIYLRGFGSFGPKKRAKKTARNISNNTTIIIPEHFAPFFKPSKSFVKKVMHNTNIK
tara:strand:+ start:108 stop:398 length:291 start_codon:yes stop_codon:yes gene_type:complete